jgi:hypothetical protein
MNLQTQKFIEYIAARSVVGAAVASGGWSCSPIELAICIKLFSESRKCRINEAEGNLLLNTFRSLFTEHEQDFDAYRRMQPLYYRWGECEFGLIAGDLLNVVKSQSFKLLVRHRLTDERHELFDERLYALRVGNFEQEEHPVYTFTYWLDFIDGYPRNSSDYRQWFNLKRDLVNFRRVGIAVFARHEWDSIELKAAQ